MLAQATFEGPTVDWWGLSPLLVLAGGGLVLMVIAALLPGRWPRGSFAFGTAVTAGAALVLAVLLWREVGDDGPTGLVADAVVLDRFAAFMTIVICAIVLLGVLFFDDYLRREELDGIEEYALVLAAAAGGVVMVSANDLVVLFIGLETLSLALYVMAASHSRRIESQESGMKYLILGSFSSAFLLYGVALVYGATGTTNLGGVSAFLRDTVLIESGLLLAGIALLLVGLAFKVAAVPFHFWAPDVYQGAPTPAAGYMAAVAKAAAFAALVRVIVVAFAAYRTDWQPVVWVLAVLTLLVGSIAAVRQTDVKRMLAYSSISHAGFILVGVEAANARGVSGVLFYVFAYAVMTLGSFGVVAVISRPGDEHTSLADVRGLATRQPWLAGTFTVFLLAQAGVPFTSGFIAKFGVIAAAVEAESYALGVIAMLTAVIAAFVYLRIIVSMFLAEPEAGDEALERVPVPVSATLGLALAVVFTLVVGLAPWWLLDVTDQSVPFLASSP